MEKSYYFLLVFPLFIFAYAVFVSTALEYGKETSPSLITTDSTYRKVEKLDTLLGKEQKTKTISSSKEMTITAKKKDAESSDISQKDSTYSYFLLASVFVILIIALPKLQELNINNSGVTLKFLDHLDEKIKEIEELAVANKAARQVNDEELQQQLSKRVTAIKESIDAYKILTKKK